LAFPNRNMGLALQQVKSSQKIRTSQVKSILIIVNMMISLIIIMMIIVIMIIIIMIMMITIILTKHNENISQVRSEDKNKSSQVNNNNSN
jgi:cytochrome bd-type quinol oxidase subunit 1